MDNYFQIPNASSLKCSIEEYGATFSMLLIKVSDEEVDYTIVFQQPYYVNAPVHWVGANFSIGTRDERERIAKQIGLTPEEIAVYRDQTTLFVAEIDQSTPYPKRIEILALRGIREEHKR